MSYTCIDVVKNIFLACLILLILLPTVAQSVSLSFDFSLFELCESSGKENCEEGENEEKDTNEYSKEYTIAQQSLNKALSTSEYSIQDTKDYQLSLHSEVFTPPPEFL